MVVDQGDHRRAFISNTRVLTSNLRPSIMLACTLNDLVLLGGCLCLSEVKQRDSVHPRIVASGRSHRMNKQFSASS